MTEKKKKKLIVVKGFNDAPYKSHRMGFALVSPPSDGRRQCHGFITCRDQLCDILRAGALKSDVNGSYVPGVNPPMDFEKTRLLMARDIENPSTEFAGIRDKLFSGKRVINVYEKMAGWQQSTITTVNHTSKSHAWLLTGPPNWMQYSNLFSMMCLILRVACEHGPLKFSKADDLPKMWQQISYINHHDCSNWIKNCHPWFPILMKRYKDIFTQQSLKETYQSGKEDYYSRGGVYSLITGGTGNQTLTKNIKKVGKEEGLIT